MTGAGLEPIRLFILDDHALFREGLCRLLASQPGFDVVGMSDTIEGALAEFPASSPEIVLLDVDLGSEKAVDFVSLARSHGYSGKILVVTAGVSDAEAVRLVQSGVSGILHKQQSPGVLCDAIRQVAAGEVYLEKRYLRLLFQSVDTSGPETRPGLSDREVKILRLILRGFANKEIGDRLSISESTVKAALRILFDKLGIRTRSQLVKVAPGAIPGRDRVQLSAGTIAPR